ncbi:MAG: hypothetical protein DMF15_12815 [Verrucomicrobia bacterium]|nr:MAG: hypothetical protein DMF15_12815 [Verrucomicrobiota bacterium]PYT70441.1 MAG: hypothetical protein DMG39_15765 [Acidobacteriota bacterium]
MTSALRTTFLTIRQRRLSPQTISTYRNTFRLLLQFIHRKTGIEPASLSIPELSVDRILMFLDSLEKERKNSVSSRNRISASKIEFQGKLNFALVVLAVAR